MRSAQARPDPGGDDAPADPAILVHAGVVVEGEQSCSVMTSPSMPATSVTCVMRRVPSAQPGLVDDQVDRRRRSARGWPARGRSTPAISTIVSSRDSASRGELACTVVSEPSWPVFMACSMSSAAPSRTSPTMMRSGRMRSALRTRSRMVISPRPSMLGGRVSRRTTCSWCSCSSAASSMVTMRSSAGMNDGQHVQRRRLARAGAAGDQRC